MSDLYYLDRAAGGKKKEPIYGRFFIQVLYGNPALFFLFSWVIFPFVSHISLLSRFYGYLQKRGKSRKKIVPFIKIFKIDEREFVQSPRDFGSFNDFFTRHLKPSCRPLAKGEDVATLPADGRHLVYPSFDQTKNFFVKGKKFDLEKLLQDEVLFKRYKSCSLVISRLCPVDCHRFHFPFPCVPGRPRVINGPLYSVNPIALKRKIMILGENKRVLTELETERFGTVLYIEVGATFVGSVKQTYLPGTAYKKGDEKGFFEFGGSCILMLFPEKSIVFDQDLVDASKAFLEVKANMGESLGVAVK